MIFDSFVDELEKIALSSQLLESAADMARRRASKLKNLATSASKNRSAYDRMTGRGAHRHRNLQEVAARRDSQAERFTARAAELRGERRRVQEPTYARRASAAKAKLHETFELSPKTKRESPKFKKNREDWNEARKRLREDPNYTGGIPR